MKFGPARAPERRSRSMSGVLRAPGRTKRQWETARTVNVPLPITGDEKIWAGLSLCMMINRHCAEFYDDNEVSSILNNIAEHQNHLMPDGFDLNKWSPR
jgi:hypothetical protein